MSLSIFRKCLFLIIIILSIYFIEIIQTKENSSPIKIMCMGDSITSGQKKTGSGSYRKFLYHNLTSRGFNIKMIGARDQGIQKYYNKKTNEKFLYQDDNSGYSAYTIRTYKDRKGLLEIIQKNKCLKLNPDIIILLIGTNNVMDNIDFDITKKDFVSLIDYILDNISSKTTLFIATIPDMNPNTKIVYKWFHEYRKSKDGKIHYNKDRVQKMVFNNVNKFNDEIKKIIEHYQSKKYNIRLENLNPVLKDIDNLLIDGVHPNNKGYKKMGEFFAEIIVKFLNENKNNV
jgi:lysophospholipase L1-like esterase